MTSSAKRKTTMAKLSREGTLRERRLNKQAKKHERTHAPSDHGVPDAAAAAEAAHPRADRAFLEAGGGRP
jgi:hypothetical protein